MEKRAAAGKSSSEGPADSRRCKESADALADVSVALAQLSDRIFSDPEWLFEIKWDGERSLAFIRDGRVELRARSGRDITAEYPELKAIVKQFNARKAIVDGEIVVLDAAGRSDFTRIQPRFGVLNPPLALQQKNPVTYYLFDLLYCDGFDLRGVALEKRKNLLRALLRPSGQGSLFRPCHRKGRWSYWQYSEGKKSRRDHRKTPRQPLHLQTNLIVAEIQNCPRSRRRDRRLDLASEDPRPLRCAADGPLFRKNPEIHRKRRNRFRRFHAQKNPKEAR